MRNEIKMCCDPREAVPYNVCDSILYKGMTSGDSFESIESCVMPYFLCGMARSAAGLSIAGLCCLKQQWRGKASVGLRQNQVAILR